MPDLATVFEFLKSVSPFVALLAGALVAWLAWLRYAEAKSVSDAEVSDNERLAKELAGVKASTATLTSKTLALSSAVANIERESTRMLASIAEVDTNAEQRFSKQVEVLVQIHEQLVQLNASHATVIGPDNAKRIIQYQWAWCRDETARLITNSVRNNGFKNREDMVARKVYEFWRKAAESSLQSLLRLEGLQYPYKHLFTSHLAVAWSQIWAWAVPLYHHSHTDTNFEPRLSDLEGRVKTLFDQIIFHHYSLVEDIDHGLFYAESRAPKDITVVNDLHAPLEMGNLLRTFVPGETDRLQPSADLRTLLAKSISAERHISDPPASSVSRIKSGLFDPGRQP